MVKVRSNQTSIAQPGQEIKLSIQVGTFLLSLQLKKIRKSTQTTVLLWYYPQIKTVKARRTPRKKTLA